MNTIKSLNESIINELYIENLEEKVDMSRISAIDLIIDTTHVFHVMDDDDCVDCGAKCPSLCASKCEGKCTGECTDLCIWDKNPENVEEETSNPNPWEDVWNIAANSSQNSSK